uniref:PCI domain-containing protein n=1 Tax=Strombidium inclinatum TaxID=197538 RepID=A0A7S3IG68_9SPIT
MTQFATLMATTEALDAKDPKAVTEKMTKKYSDLVSKFHVKTLDVIGFLDFIQSKDVEHIISNLPHKATKKRVFSFERFTFIVMPMFKYLEDNSKDFTKTKAALDKWSAYVQAHNQLSLNATFEVLLNLFLLLGEHTSMKAQMFVNLVKFTDKHDQLPSVMIRQVEQIRTLSREWDLSTEERISLYIECAKALENNNSASTAYSLYYDALVLLEKPSVPKASKAQFQPYAISLVQQALRCPEVFFFDEITLLESVKELKTSAKDLFGLIDFYLTSSIAEFKKGLANKKKLLEENKIEKEAAILKKQYIILSHLKAKDHTKDGDMVISYKQLCSLLEISQDDIEEFIIEAKSSGVIDALLDEIKEEVIVKTQVLKGQDTEDWVFVKNKVSEWKNRFVQIEQVLAATPEKKK